MRFITLIAAAFLAVCSAVAQDSPRAIFEFKDGDRVVFLGDTMMEREGNYGYIEATITSRLQGKKVIFRNLAWSADTVLGESRASFDPPEKGFELLKEPLQAIKPTVAFLAYGMAESFKGDAGLEKFRKDINTLIDTISDISKPTVVRFVIVTPIFHENLGAPLPKADEHNAQLAKYAATLREIAQQRKARLIDVFGAMADYHKTSNQPPFTDNGIHPSPFGYWNLATFFERELGLYPGPPRIGFGADGTMRPGSSGVTATATVKTGSSLVFNGRDRFMMPPLRPAGHNETVKDPGLLMQVVGLQAGKYTLKIDGEVAAVFTDKEWGVGQHVMHGPLMNQVEELRKTIVKKNELFFYRWRPQNQTYLFGFRKYEQGQNAKEIPMFDPLISEQEEKIVKLTELKTRNYEFGGAEPDDEQKLAPKPAAKETLAEIDPTPLPHPNFDLAPDLEVTLWAENPNLAKPIHMNFDPQGRLWVASSSVYPQIEPGKEANDKILILEDTNEDGKADKTTVFADGLLIPTGVAPGDGGAYVANSTELLFYRDHDGDGRADEKRVMLSGFGTEDTHHILHTLRWGHDGQLYMNQSIYIHSHIETPHGVVRLDSGGILNLRPPTQELGIHMKGLINSWGHHFDNFGQSFATDGAGGEGINWIIPQAMYVTYEGARKVLHGVSPGNYPKFCGLEVVESEHFPEDWQGSLVTCDFRAHRVVRFGVNEQGAGYVTKELPDLMRTTNVTFRPIDVKVGPDGALYIADWSNPIIQHGEVDFRDPRRDHEHGRIWRVTYKGRPLLKKPDLLKASNAELFANLSSKNGQLRQQSRRVLTERGEAKIKADLESWTQKQSSEQGQLEALWMWQSIDSVNVDLLKKTLAAKDGRVRAAATRVLSFWQNRIPDALNLIAPLVADEHPRVRVEAVRTAAKIPSARSAELVLSALNKPMDRFLDYAIWLSINDLAEPWVKAVQSGEWKVAGREKQLEFALLAIEPAHASIVLSKVLADQPIPKDGSGPWIDLIAKAGSREHLDQLLQKILGGDFNDAAVLKSLGAFSEAARLRQLAPEKDKSKINSLFAHSNQEIRAASLRIAGKWHLQEYTDELLAIAGKPENATAVRSAAFQGLRDLGGNGAVEGLTKLAAAVSPQPVRVEAVKALAALDLAKATPLAIEVLTATENEEAALNLWRALLANKGAAASFTQLLPKSGLPTPMVKAGLRAAREGGRNEPNLVLALARNIDEGTEAASLSPEELQRLLTSIKEKGDPARGELIYRRQELGCVSCHAIGGIGGKVGPDLTSIGASAQPDYLVESLLFPNRKVKEGYHSVILETKDEMELSGILVRETDDQLFIRDASNREVAVAKNNIANKRVGGSLMPAGLIDPLNEQEQADLYRFLSELGKPGRYDASKGNIARVWQVIPRTLDVAQFPDDKVVTMEKLTTIEHNEWQPMMTLVDGRLLKTEFENLLKSVHYRDPDAIYAKTKFEVPKSGPVRLQLPKLAKAIVWIDGKPVEAREELSVDLASGTHILAVKLDAKALPDHLSASTPDGTFLSN
jgi:putative heme-binding domain-containing protein